MTLTTDTAQLCPGEVDVFWVVATDYVSRLQD
jgi:hypothetical protein